MSRHIDRSPVQIAIAAFTLAMLTLLLARGVSANAGPEFTATTLDGAEVSLADLRGEVVLLNTWATWCTPCKEEMPWLQVLSDRYGAEGLQVVGVSIDRAGQDDTVRSFASEHGAAFSIWRDPSNRFSRAFETTGVPETLLIGRDGAVLYRWKGALVEDISPIYDAAKKDWYAVAVKGAPDIVLNLCSAYQSKDCAIKPLDETAREKILAANEALTKDALRVLGFAYRLVPECIDPESTQMEEIEKDLVFVGMVGMIDPARPEVSPALEKARGAGIRSTRRTATPRSRMTMARTGTKQIAVLLYPGMTALDVVGTMEVLISLHLRSPYRIVTVAERSEPIPTDTSLTMTPAMTIGLATIAMTS